MVSEMLDVPLPHSVRSSEDSRLEDMTATLAKYVIPQFLRDSDEVVSQSNTSLTDSNLLEKIHRHHCCGVRISGTTLNNKGLHDGTGISYWVGHERVGYGIICVLKKFLKLAIFKLQPSYYTLSRKLSKHWS
jgi:hypothetical protein